MLASQRITLTHSSDSQTAEPIFLEVDDVVELHDYNIGLDPNERGLLSENALHSAVAAPRNTFHYEGGDLCYLAATYLYHIAKAHAFQNGNKRTAYAAALTFLDLNGVVIARPSRALEDATVAVADNRMEKEELAKILRALTSCDD